MDSSGCNLGDPINIASGQVCYVETSCHGSTLSTFVYFTGCVCQNGADTVKLPCCPKHGLNDNPNGNLENKENLNKSSYKLNQNYPNPFNPSTNIQFEIPIESYVKLSIYDSKGTLVQTLVNGNLKKGYHEFLWNGTNYASGVYFYKLEAGNFKEEKKMILLK